jgi:hypothetical protein
MPAKERATEDPKLEPPMAATGEADQASPATFQTEGDVPAVGKGGATPATATASQLAFGTKATADSASIEHGVHQPEEYKQACEAAGKPDKWHERYRNGHTGATAWTEPGKVGMKFDLKRGHSASAALAEWFKGPTIADFRTISVAEQLDELRDELGDGKFDSLFGSADGHQDGAIPGTQRLSIAAAMYTTPFIDQMKAVARKQDDKINKPEAAKPEAAPPAEEKKPRPGKDAQAKHDTKADQHDQDVSSKRELGFGREDLERV